MTDNRHDPTALVVGASRALGLHDLADQYGGDVEVEAFDVTEPAQIVELRNRLDGRVLDLLFVNATITRGNTPAADVPTEVFAELMITNALSPMRIIDHLQDLVSLLGHDRRHVLQPGQHFAQHHRRPRRL